MRLEAQKQGIRPATLRTTLDRLELNQKVLQLYHRQPEKAQTLSAYLKRRVSQTRIKRGRALLAEHSALLDEVANRYGVQPRFIVALWGTESDYGGNMGDFSVVRSLATLAYGSKRPDYFRRELMVALRILDQGHISPDQMIGSWAGAMGQCQFMPWSFSRRAVDFDANGKRDIWHSHPDVFASIANYLASQGWRGDLTWGRAVSAPPGLDPELLKGKTSKDLEQWQALGIRRADGRDLPRRSVQARLMRPENGGGRIFILYENFDVLLKWNRSNHFAIAVGTLADRIGG